MKHGVEQIDLVPFEGSWVTWRKALQGFAAASVAR
jgi:hypothetical protein